MNKIKYITLLGATMLLTGIGFSSCNDVNDWEVDPSYARLFSSNKLAIESDIFEATVTFKTTPQTEYYIIEISKDTLYDDIQMGVSETSKVFGVDKSITTSPFTMTDLDKDTKYYLRVKSMSAVMESRWAYPEKFTFKTKMEQIVTKYVQTTNTVTLEWKSGYTVTNVEVKSEKPDENRTIQLPQEALDNCTFTIEDLSPLTNYTVYLKNEDDIKGYATFLTYSDVPEADKTVALSDETPLTQTLINEIAAELGASADNLKTVTFTLPSGMECITLNEDGNRTSLSIPDGLSVNFYGEAGEQKAVLRIAGMGDSGSASTTSLKIGGKHQCITFYNLIIDGQIDETNNVLSFIDEGTECSVGILSFNDCEIRNYARALLRMQKTTNKIINQFIVENSIIHHFGGNNYAFMVAKGGEGAIDELIFKQSTFHNFVAANKGFLSFENNNNIKKIDISDCTFYNQVADGGYFIDFKDAAYGAEELNITNCIMGKTIGAKAKGGRGKVYSIVNSYKTADWSQTGGNAIAGFDEYEKNASELFEDPDNGNFFIKDIMDFAGYDQCGDPRWYSANK